MAILDYHIDFFNFKLQLTRLNENSTDLNGQDVVNRILHYIQKYGHSAQITLNQAELLLRSKSHVFPLMLQYAPERFMQTVFSTSAAAYVRLYGLVSLINRPFASLNDLDKLCLLYVESYCAALDDGQKLANSTAISKIEYAASLIRQVEKVYEKVFPSVSFLKELYAGASGESVEITEEDWQNILTGKGRTGLTIVPNTENNRNRTATERIACRPLKDGLAFVDKTGMYYNMIVEEAPERQHYMDKHNIAYKVGDNGYVIDTNDPDALLAFSYLDLYSLWPKIRYFQASRPMLADDDEQEFMKSRIFCSAAPFDLKPLNS